ncbi:LmeA family phospholipid-binding protein [Amycolatopsis marina]|uniref:LmeA family phospholipid-binding protein n=1 Tax=Amycolatopsis marina TaxID=490629 RepID=UPI000B87DAF3|nr:DUF2993 domain-containing protein [Amycolatopsis marina]
MVSSPVTQQNRRGPARPVKRKGRRTKKIVIVLLVLAGLLVGADFALAAVAEHTVSQKAREQLGLTEDPSVTVHGFPFTTQALSGDYRHISVSATGVPVQDTLRDVGVAAELRDVDAPLSDLMAGNVDNIKINEVEGQVRIKDSDIARVDPLDKIENLRIAPSTEDYVRHGDEGAVEEDAAKEEKDGSSAGIRLSGEVQIAGERVEIIAFAIIDLDGNTVRISPERLEFGNGQDRTVVPPEVQQTLLPSFEADISTGSLPFTVTPTDIEVESGAIVVKGTAENVRFSGMSGN